MDYKYMYIEENDLYVFCFAERYYEKWHTRPICMQRMNWKKHFLLHMFNIKYIIDNFQAKFKVIKEFEPDGTTSIYYNIVFHDKENADMACEWYNSLLVVNQLAEKE